MNSLTYSVSVYVTLILIFATYNEVSALPDPCFWKQHKVKHVEPTTPTATAATPALKQIAKLKKKNPLEKLTDWLFWSPSTDGKQTRPKNPVDKLIMNYVKFLSNILHSFN